MRVTVSAAYETHTLANRAIDDLVAAGFDHDAISVVMTKSTRDRYYSSDSATAWGAGVGAVVGGLAALAAAPVTFFAAGPLFALLGGSLLGATGGGLLGALVDLGMPEEQARIMADQLESGAVLVAVHAESERRAAEAEAILSNVKSPVGHRVAVQTTRELHP